MAEKPVHLGPYIIKNGKERILPATGLAVIGAMLSRSALTANVDTLRLKEVAEPKIPHKDVILTYLGLLAMGHTEYAAVNMLSEDAEAAQLNLSLSVGLPSEATLRQRMDQFGDKLRNPILRTSVEMFTKHKITPSANAQGYTPVDIDVTPMDNSDSKKEGVSRTYAGYDGYAPIMAYLGTEGYMVNTELRLGKQHSQKETLSFLWESLQQAKQITGPTAKLLVRLDSGNDAAENIGARLDNGADYLIKRNLRKESKDNWMLDAMTAEFLQAPGAKKSKPRPGKTVRTGSMPKAIEITHASGFTETRSVRVVYEVIERTSRIKTIGGKAEEQMCMVPEVEVNTWRTSLRLSEEEVIAMYHAHGECEQYHSELKTDMGVERLPSGKLETNKLVLELAMLAYNALRIIGQESLKENDTPLKKPAKRRRLSTVIKHLALIAAHLTRHARAYWLSLGASNAWTRAFVRIAGCYG